MKVSFFPRLGIILVRFGGLIKLSHPKDLSTCQRPFWGVNPVVDSDRIGGPNLYNFNFPRIIRFYVFFESGRIGSPTYSQNLPLFF